MQGCVFYMYLRFDLNENSASLRWWECRREYATCFRWIIWAIIWIESLGQEVDPFATCQTSHCPLWLSPDSSSSAGAGCYGTDLAEASSVLPFSNRSAHRSSGESVPGWGPSIAKTPFWPGRVCLWPDFSPRCVSMGDSHQEESPLIGSGHDLLPLLGVVEAVGVAPEGAQLIAFGETILLSRAPSMRKLYALKLRLRVQRPPAWSS